MGDGGDRRRRDLVVVPCAGKTMTVPTTNAVAV
jgi:hypothetical protein